MKLSGCTGQPGTQTMECLPSIAQLPAEVIPAGPCSLLDYPPLRGCRHRSHRCRPPPQPMLRSQPVDPFASGDGLFVVLLVPNAAQ